MSCALATRLDVGRWFVFTCTIVSLGCMRIAELPPPDPSNPLPQGVERNGADFLKQIDTYKPTNNPHERDRTAKCFWCSKIKVRIVALGDTYAIEPSNPPASGRPVAHLFNMDKKHTEKYYGLLPGTQADYYLWVDARSSTQAQWTLLELSHITNSVSAALPQHLNYCHKYTGRKPVSEADFAKDRKEGPCDYPIPEANPKVTQASLMPTSAFVALVKHAFAFLETYALDEGAWIYCNNGCCT